MEWRRTRGAGRRRSSIDDDDCHVHGATRGSPGGRRSGLGSLRRTRSVCACSRRCSHRPVCRLRGATGRGHDLGESNALRHDHRFMQSGGPAHRRRLRTAQGHWKGEIQRPSTRARPGASMGRSWPEPSTSC